MTTVLLVVFFVLLLLEVPIAHCMLLSSLCGLLYLGVDPIMVGLETARSLTSFYSFLAVPFFILAGELMSYGGLSQRLIGLVQSLIGHYRSGLPAVTTVSSQLFGAVSGASAATCAAVGGIMIPALERHGFNRAFASALAACSGTTGALIPPSIALLIYGTVANVSIEKLFIGGILPGVLMGAGIILVSRRLTRTLAVQGEPKAGLREVARRLYGAVFAILLVVIIFAGIMGGVFTATEASAVAVVYAALVGFAVYRKLTVRALPGILLSSAKTTASLSFLIACASLFSWTLSMGKAPEALTANLMAFSETVVGLIAPDGSPETIARMEKIVVLIVLNLSLLVVGMFIDVGPGLLIVVPVVLPISEAIGMGEGLAAVHFGVMVVSNLVIGLVTPPVGSTLFVASATGKVNVGEMVPYVMRFFGIMVAVQFLIAFVPFLTTFLPGRMN